MEGRRGALETMQAPGKSRRSLGSVCSCSSCVRFQVARQIRGEAAAPGGHLLAEAGVKARGEQGC